jgi:hypothetical protein
MEISMVLLMGTWDKVPSSNVCGVGEEVWEKPTSLKGMKFWGSSASYSNPRNWFVMASINSSLTGKIMSKDALLLSDAIKQEGG